MSIIRSSDLFIPNESECGLILYSNAGYIRSKEEVKKLISICKNHLKLKDSFIKLENKKAEESAELYREEPSKKDRQLPTGYIYLIESVNGFKIGKTTTPKKRFEYFTVKLPFNIKPLFWFKVEDYHKVELYLQNKFDFKHINGEWFDLSELDIKYIETYLKEREYNGDTKT